MRTALLTIGFALACWIAVSAPAEGVRPSLSYRKHRVRVSGPPGQLQALSRLVRLCLEEFDRFVSRPVPPPRLPWLHVAMSPSESLENLPPSSLLALQPEAPLTVAVHEVMRRLVLRQVASGSLPTEDGSGSHYEWIAAGLAYRVRYAAPSARIRPPLRYSVLQEHIRGRTLPDVRRVIETPVPAEEELFYRWFSVQCRLLLDVLSRESESSAQAVPRLLRLLVAGRSPGDAVAYMAAPLRGTAETFMEWYYRAAGGIIRGAGASLSIEGLKRRIAEAEVVTLVVAEAEGGSRKREVPVHRLGSLLDTPTVRRSMAGQLESDFNKLIRVSPPLLREPLLDYAKSFDLLRRGRSRRFSRAAEAAAESVWKAVHRYEELCRYLRRTERNNVSLENLYPFHVHAVRAFREARQNLSPEFRALLEEARDL